MTISRGMKLVAVMALPLVAAGCTTAYSAKDAGFVNASLKSGDATGKQTVWIQNQQQAAEARARVKALMAKKTIDTETAVQVALLNNRGLQAAYADLGDSAADAWQTQLSVFPTFSVGVSGIGTPGLEAYRMLEGAIAANILALATYDRDMKLAETRFTLVLWQTGAVEAAHGAPPEELAKTVAAGIAAVREGGSDLVLVDPQYSRFLSNKMSIAPYLQVLSQAAQAPDVALFRRYDLVKYWADNGQHDLERAKKADRETAVDGLHTCLGVVLANFVAAGAGLSVGQ